jgi:hypothetical protein
MATITVSTSQNINAVTYAAGDTLSMTNGAVLTIDLEDAGDLAKLATKPGTIQCVTSGALSVVNASTTTPQVVTLNSNTQDFRFEKNGRMTVRGAAIELGTGTGASGQAFDLSVSPYDVIPYPSYVEVETGVGTGIYLPWFVVPVAGKPVLWTASQFCGGGYVAGNVFFWNATTRSLYVGDDTNGNTLTSGVKVRIPNIYFHSATTNANPTARSQLDLSPTGTFDGEWFAFSDYFHIVTTTFNSVRWINGGIAGNLALTSSNGTLEVDGLALCPDTEQTTFLQQLSIQTILGETSIKRVSSLTNGLVTGANKNVFAKLYALTAMEDITCARRTGIVSLTVTRLPSEITIKNLSAIGGRLELTNITDIIFDNLKVAYDLGTAQITTSTTNALLIVNCARIVFVGLGMAGVSQCRAEVINPDDQSSNIEIYNANFDGGNNTVGMVNGNVNGIRIVNSTITNLRAGSHVVNSPATFLLSGVEILNCRTVPVGTLFTEANQGGVYDLLPCAPSALTTTFTGATNFAFSNLIDPGLTPTTGSIVCGPFGTNDCISLSGSANFDQAGGLEFPVSGDIVEVESCFVLHGVTSFQNVAPVFTYTEASSLKTDTSTPPTNLSFDFRIKNPTGAYGAYVAYNATNLATAISALTGYDSDEGFKIQMRITATGTDSTLVFNQTYFLTNVDNAYNAPDASFTLAGPNPTDVTTLYRYSDDAVLATFTGGGEHFFYGAANNYLSQVYFIRRDALGFEIMRTRSSPHTLVLGDNGTEALFAGAEVQLAQSSTVTQNNELLNSILLLSQRVDALIENSSGDRFTVKALETAGGGSLTATDIRVEIDANSTQLAAILLDTSELQTNQGNWLTATGFAVAGDEMTLENNSITASVVATNAFNNSAFTTGFYNSINAEIYSALADYEVPTLAEMDAAFTEIKGPTFTSTDTLEAIRDRGDAAWTTATGFSTFNPASDQVIVATNNDKTDYGLSAIERTTLAAVIWNVLTSGFVTVGSVGKRILDNLNATVSSRATSTNMVAVKAKTDLLTFTGTDVRATLDGEEVVTDAASRTASQATGFATPANVTASQAAIVAEVNANEAKIDALETKASRLDALIENVTGYRFTAKALETAPTAEMGEVELHTALDSYTNKAIWKADISGLALQASLLTIGDIDARLNAYGAPTLTEMTAAFTEIKGPTFTSTDTLEAIQDAVTAGGTTITAADVLAEFKPDLTIINEGVKNASLIVPHSTDLT